MDLGARHGLIASEQDARPAVRSLPSAAARRRRGSKSRGQSLVEFAVTLPVMLAIVGVLIDAARLYKAWTDLESATRDAAQYLARSSSNPASVDYTTAGTKADTKAAYIVGTATGVTFTRSSTQGTLTDCSQAHLTTTYVQNTALAGGGSTQNPAATATVTTCLPFHTLFAYPFLTSEGNIVLRTERKMTILVGR
jgi:Flp pilus assembly protein TadG